MSGFDFQEFSLDSDILMLHPCTKELKYEHPAGVRVERTQKPKSDVYMQGIYKPPRFWHEIPPPPIPCSTCFGTQTLPTSQASSSPGFQGHGDLECRIFYSDVGPATHDIPVKLIGIRRIRNRELSEDIGG